MCIILPSYFAHRAIIDRQKVSHVMCLPLTFNFEQIVACIFKVIVIAIYNFLDTFSHLTVVFHVSVSLRPNIYIAPFG